MRHVVPILCIAIVVAFAVPAMAQSRLTGVDPLSAKVGDLLSATGENIEKGKVVELYLTDGTNDIRVAMIEQSATSIKFKVPDSVKPGRYALMIKTGGPDPKLLEQPVKVSIE